jgi:TatD DNase family protein
MTAIGGSEEANALAVSLAERYPDRIRAAVGYDRDEAEGSPLIAALEAVLRRPGVGAVGETGLDYHYGKDTASAQRTLFAAMLAVAGDHRLPVVVHSREADEDTLRMLREHAAGRRADPDRIGVLHCFTGDDAFADALLEIGFFISFSGIVTFPGAAALRDVARRVPLHRLLIETDAPYLAPPPHRGKRNEPAYVVRVAEVLAEVRGIGVPEVAAATHRNASRLFGWTESATSPP